MPHNAVVDRIKDVLSGRPDIDIGNFQWVNLEMVKDEVGDQWETIRTKIYNAAHTFLEKRISDDDVLIRCRGGFVLFFAELQGEDADERTQALSTELNRFFLGDRILGKLAIEATSRTVKTSDLADFVAKSLTPAAANDRTDLPEDRRAAAAATWRPIQSESRTSSAPNLSPAQAQAEQGPAKQDSAAPRISDQSDLHRPHQDHDPLIDPTADLAGLTTLPFKIPDPEWEDIIFKPCWDAQHEYVTANFCLPRRSLDGRNVYGRATLVGNDDPDLLETMDHCVAVAAQRGFLKMLTVGRKCAIVIPVHYQTVIGVQDRIRYFSILQCVPLRMRKYFYIRVDEIPDGAPIGQMEELFRSMKLFGSNLLAKVPAGTVDFGRFSGCRVDIYSTSMKPEWNALGLPDGVASKLAQQSVSIQRAGCRGALTQVDCPELLQFGLDAGYEIFTGDVVGKDQSRPMPLVQLPRPTLLKQAS